MSETPSENGALPLLVGSLISIYGSLFMFASGLDFFVQPGSGNILTELLYTATLGSRSFVLGIVILGVGIFIQQLGE